MTPTTATTGAKDIPPTSESVFRSTFSQAPGNPPFHSALLETVDAQKVIDHKVKRLLGNPREYEILTTEDLKPGDVRTFTVEEDGRMVEKVLRVYRRQHFAQDTRYRLFCRG